jgi:hypothetical protein
MNVRTFGRMMFVIFPIFFIFAIVFNIYLMGECKKDGYSTFACMSMMQNGSYLIVNLEKEDRRNVDPR